MTGWDEPVVASNFKDVMVKAIRRVLGEERPPYKDALVISIDRVNRTCVVTYQGESSQVTVAMPSVQPTGVGQWVRVDGLPGDRHVVAVLGYPQGFVTGTITGLYRSAGTCTVLLAGGATVTAQIASQHLWPFGSVRCLHDGTSWVALGCIGECRGFEDDFVGGGVGWAASGANLYAGSGNWQYFLSGSSGAGANLYSGHMQMGNAYLATGAVSGNYMTIATPSDAIGMAWFTTGGLWFSARMIGGSARGDNACALTCGIIADSQVTWGATASGDRAACIYSHPGMAQPSRMYLRTTNDTSENFIDTGVVLADQTPYDIDILVIPRYTPQNRLGAVYCWIDGVLRASLTNHTSIPNAFTTAGNGMRIGASVATTNGVAKAGVWDRMGAKLVAPATAV